MARTLLLLVALPAAGGGLLGLGLWAIGFAETTRSSIGGSNRAPRLAAISIPRAACPYLEAVHAANVDLWDTGDLVATRRSARTQFLAKVDPLVLSLSVSATHVPAPLRGKLTDAAGQLERVRRSWSKPNGDAATFSSLLDYGRTFGDAGDLVGDGCGFSL